MNDLQPSDIPARIGIYRVLRLLGSGAMGDVYLAFDHSLDRNVALKIMAPQLSRDPAFRKRFKSEAAAVAQLHHPNIVPIYFTGEENGQPYFAMQYVDGESLEKLLKREERLSEEQTIQIALHVLAGLSAAHAAGMVHRDIKPGNILLSKDGHSLIVDFGLVKCRGESQTMTGVVMGTVDFLSPEQASGASVDGRSDLYSRAVFFTGCCPAEIRSGPISPLVFSININTKPQCHSSRTARSLLVLPMSLIR